ncbi:hypothetical protein HDU82_004727 [Entophlyctis luteolus]|nr:hypothetical protein HDU82_004727 [Entophlyctis luteolus]
MADDLLDTFGTLGIDSDDDSSVTAVQPHSRFHMPVSYPRPLAEDGVFHRNLPPKLRPSALLFEAERFYLLGEYHRALEACGAWMDHQTDGAHSSMASCIEVCDITARCHLMLGDLNAALSASCNCRDVDADHPTQTTCGALFFRAQLYSATHQYAEAAKALFMYSRVRPSDYRAVLAVGSVLAHLKTFAKDDEAKIRLGVAATLAVHHAKEIFDRSAQRFHRDSELFIRREAMAKKEFSKFSDLHDSDLHDSHELDMYADAQHMLTAVTQAVAGPGAIPNEEVLRWMIEVTMDNAWRRHEVELNGTEENEESGGARRL